MPALLVGAAASPASSRNKSNGQPARARLARTVERAAAAPILRQLTIDPVLAWGWRRYSAGGTTPPQAYRAMRTAFLARESSTWRRLDRRALNEAPRLAVDAKAAGLVAGHVEELHSELRRSGLAMLPGLLSADVCDEITSHARNATCTLVDPSSGPSTGVFDASAPRSIRYDLPEEGLLASTCVQRVLADESLITLAQKYLGGSPVEDLVAGWWSAPGQGSRSRAAQLFHFDLDRPRFLKLFIYLTDVDQQSGPHAFVRGTHRALPARFRADRRYTDDEVEAHFGKDVVRVSGPRGTAFLADTRALHKGEPVLRGARLVVQFEWATSLFGAPYARPVLRVATHELATAIRRFPTAYRRFVVDDQGV